MYPKVIAAQEAGDWPASYVVQISADGLGRLVTLEPPESGPLMPVESILAFGVAEWREPLWPVGSLATILAAEIERPV